MHDVKLVPWHTDTPTQSGLLTTLAPPGAQQPLTLLLAMCRSPFSPFPGPSLSLPRLYNGTIFKTIWLTASSSGLVLCSAWPSRELGTSHSSNELKTNSNEKTGILEPVEVLEFHTKALKSPHVQTLSATPACDPAVCGTAAFLNRLQISTQHFNRTASSAKLRQTEDSNTFSLWFSSDSKSHLKLRWQKATPKQSYQRLPPARQQHQFTQSTCLMFLHQINSWF